MTKMGRPKADNPHHNLVTCRFTDSELEELKKRATMYNLTIAETIRKDLGFKKAK